MRKVETENNRVNPGKSVAASSHEATYYHLVSPETIKRLAKRKTSGAIKYGANNWRVGINDADYVRDRFNHMFQHMLLFMESGNEHDDNLGAILWSVDCLIEVERLCPEALKQVVGVCSLFGKSAEQYVNEEKKRRGEATSKNHSTNSDRVRRPRRRLAKRR